MNLKNYLLTLILILGYSMGVTAQETHISLVQQQTDRSDQQCYSIMLSNADQDLHLAGQNYRLYYNGHHARYVDGSLKSLLPDSYTTARVVEHHHDMDASAYGGLLFE